jgi:hypothetical protein
LISRYLRTQSARFGVEPTGRMADEQSDEASGVERIL